ncbi:AraC family transcriptional regulator [Pedobacter sp. V48]|uniref:helix-turn-helix domain-containing protein n=1 Tax=Pedobacter sp. V48 TaxID=509635 RepID=UPI0003E54F39|nr:AraC family transcriptional regulator [Pedobacter sp. V48]ETZ22141.1 hypothetical protein N824_24765 [Pedobacter sp. V48]
MSDAIPYLKGCFFGSKIKESVFGSVTTSETVFSAGLSSDWHYHANPHFSHILSGGSTEIRASDAQLQEGGKGLYYYPGIPHQNIYYRPDTRIFNVELDYSFFEKHQLEVPGESLMFDSSIPLNTGGLIRILREHRLNDINSGISIDQLCINLIRSNSKLDEDHPDWTNIIRDILNDNWNGPLSLVELSNLVGLHPVTVSRYFTKYFGCTFGEYLRRIKVERAVLLLRNGKIPLTEIAYHCGFFDQAHFTKTFRGITGFLPKHYRNI